MPKTKLTPKDVVILRGLYNIGMNIRSLSALFKISYEQTRKIVRRQRWTKDVPIGEESSEIIIETAYPDDGS
jgi:hypothetical protein